MGCLDWFRSLVCSHSTETLNPKVIRRVIILVIEDSKTMISSLRVSFLSPDRSSHAMGITLFAISNK
ncbi:hypothetical protein GBA52_007891 [Prunus armeniaca]|nr:hypothetical protein GBA52_007891 [Prunus armeniaca]